MQASGRWVMVLVAVLGFQLKSAQAQYARYEYPRGYANFGWGGWGAEMGGQTIGGDAARGLGTLAASAGSYNQQTAEARAVNADTVTKWNQYWYESQVAANRSVRERMEKRQAGTNQALDKLHKRLRDHPEPRDIYQGSALNVAAEEINDPRVYAKALAAANVKIGGETIRDIPFQHAAGAITTSIHRLTQGQPPAALMTPTFEPYRKAFRPFGQEIRKQLDEGDKVDPETVKKALALIVAAEAKVAETLQKNSRERVEADKYLKALHGLIAMLNTPALDFLLAGVEKRPDATLADLLQFMNAFNLRFGVAETQKQKAVYDALYPKLVALRNEIAPILAKAPEASSSGSEAGEFFSGMAYDDIKKKAPTPPPQP